MPNEISMSLASLSGRDYIGQIKARLRDDEAWAELVVPNLIGRTRWGLLRLSESLNDQIERASSDVSTDTNWLHSVHTLLGLVDGRLNETQHRPEPKQEQQTIASSREARAWRGFAAKLAEVVMEVDPSALRGVQTPYGDLEVEDWLAAREAKKLSREER